MTTVVFDTSSHLIETRFISTQIDMSCVDLLTCRYIVQLCLDHCKHFSNSIEDTAREFVLIIDCKPATQHLSDILL